MELIIYIKTDLTLINLGMIICYETEKKTPKIQRLDKGIWKSWKSEAELGSSKVVLYSVIKDEG